MRAPSILAAAGLVTAALVPLAWTRPELQEQGLVKVPPGQQEHPGEGVRIQDPAPEFDRKAWRERLLDHDLDAREASFEELIVLARESAEAREVLETWAVDDFELELAWTSRLALREARRAPQTDGATPFLDPRAPFGSLAPRMGPDLRQLESMRERMRALERELDSLFGRRGLHGFDPFDAFQHLPPGGQGFSGRSLRMETGPDGVRVEVQVEENGETRTETYEAPSLEELLEQHPELRDRISAAPLGPGAVPVPPVPGVIPGLGLDDLRGSTGSGPRTDVLGVMMREPASADEVVAEGLEPGVGLRVQQVLPGTLARELGVQPGDVLVELEGRALRSGQDVREALAGRRPEESLELRVRREGRTLDLTWKP